MSTVLFIFCTTARCLHIESPRNCVNPFSSTHLHVFIHLYCVIVNVPQTSLFAHTSPYTLSTHTHTHTHTPTHTRQLIVCVPSLTQVHRAVLHDGSEVAVKVQYPGVADSIDSDIENLMTVLRLTGAVTPGLCVVARAHLLFPLETP